MHRNIRTYVVRTYDVYIYGCVCTNVNVILNDGLHIGRKLLSEIKLIDDTKNKTYVINYIITIHNIHVKSLSFNSVNQLFGTQNVVYA